MLRMRAWRRKHGECALCMCVGQEKRVHSALLRGLRTGERDRNSSTCGSEAGERKRGIIPLCPSPIFVYMSPPSDEGNSV